MSKQQAKQSKVVDESLEKAREIEKHSIPEEGELQKEHEEVQSLARKLYSYLTPQWYLEPDVKEKKEQKKPKKS